MTAVGFIGLGSIGAPMAWNVGEAHDLVVYNRSPRPAALFEEAGVPAAATPKDLAETSEVIVLVVRDGEAVLDILEGEQGVLAGLSGEETLVQMSTISPEATERAKQLVEEAGAAFVDAPVLGTVPPAKQGTLTILASGPDPAIDAVEPVLQTMGEPIIRAGEAGNGTKLKLSLNLALGGMMEAYAEALTLGAKHGLSVDTMIEAFESGGLASPLFSGKSEKIAAGDFEPQFTLDLLEKDLSLALDAGGEAELPLPVAGAAREAVEAARGLGHGTEDMAAVIRFLETVGDIEVRR
jgi:3-hydroxyisobutyrate dehydrogenase-like beta-hydroxyacid dehydrogenase